MPPPTPPLPISVQRHEQVRQNNVQGAAFIVLCCMLLAAINLIAKTLGPQVAGDDALHPFQIGWARFFFGAMAIVPLAMFRGVSFCNTSWHLHLGRSFFGMGGITATFAAVGVMQLATATAISFLSPLIAMVLAVLFLREKVGPWRWGAAATAFLGTLILTQPGTEAFQPAALIALCAAVFMGTELIFIKVLSGREPRIKILLINNVMGACLATIPAALFWRMPTLEQWGLLVLIGAMMICAQTMFLKGIAMAEATVATPFVYTTLVFATIYGWMIFGEIPTGTTLMGAAVIITGALILAWRENRVARNSR